MAEDWLADVRKYAPNADPDVVAGLVRYCGIALHKRDSSLIAFSSPDEIGRVRERFLKKKLALTDPDSALDEAIAAVGATMKGDRTKNRVTVYYLLADRFDKLPMFLKAPNAGASGGKSAPATAATIVSTPSPVRPASPGANDDDVAPAGFGRRAVESGSSGPAPGQAASTADRSAAGDRPRMAEEPSAPGVRWWPWLLLVLAIVVLVLLMRSCGRQ